MGNAIHSRFMDAVCARIERQRRITAWVIAAMLLGAALALRPAWPATHPMTELLEELGVLFMAAAICGRIFCMMYIGGQKNRTLLREGPYSVCRNPLYLCSIVGATGAGMTAASFTMGALSAVLFLALFTAIVRSEERRLAPVFGPPYLDYLREVPRWMPVFRLWRDPPSLSPRGALIARTLRDSAALFIAVPVMELIEYAHATGRLPALLVVL